MCLLAHGVEAFLVCAPVVVGREVFDQRSERFWSVTGQILIISTLYSIARSILSPYTVCRLVSRISLSLYGQLSGV